MKPQRIDKSWRRQTAANIRRVASVLGLRGSAESETDWVPAAATVPNLTYLEDSQFEDAMFEEEAMLIDPQPAALEPPPPALPTPPQASPLPASAFAPQESARLALPRLPGSNTERHDFEDHLEATFRQRSAEIAEMIARRHAPVGDTPAKRPRLGPAPSQEASRRRRSTNGGLPGFELM